ASELASATIARAHDTVATFLNARDAGHVVLGSSTTALLHTIANAYADALASGDLPRSRNRIIVSTIGHEANIHPWMRLASRGFEIVPWPHTVMRDSRGDAQATLTLDSLAPLLDNRTLLVVFPEVSNIIGEIYDAPAITRAAHAVGARTVVDAVAYAPHRLPDVRTHGHDWYVYSTYKVFGPHAAAMYGSHDAFAPLTGPNHFFIPRDRLPYKFELGGFAHEAAAAIASLTPYLRFLADAAPAASDRVAMELAYARLDELERAAAGPLLEYLGSHPRVTLFGGAKMIDGRVATISFRSHERSSRDIARALTAQGLCIKHGDFYSRRLVESLGMNPDDGVVRISLAHYNTPDEISRVRDALDRLL
ncbi:MAG: aminotransferase class V-fold PLP-dependent enzyme, partial [Phycisphaerales bacterium]